jgi:hypothetical protein
VAREFILNFEKSRHYFGDITKNPVLILDAIRQKRILGHEESLVWYLRSTWRSKYTEPKDKVYALLGLAREKDRPNLVPDYGPSETCINVYAKVVKHCIDVDESLNILSFHRNRTDNIMDLLASIGEGYAGLIRYSANWPTWIPRFDIGLMDGKTNPHHLSQQGKPMHHRVL